MKLSIAYWNIAGSKPLAALALEDSVEYDIIAIQEPWVNPHTGGTYALGRGRYTVVYRSGNAAIYVHKRHAREAWEPGIGSNWSRVTFGEGDQVLNIWSIYSPIRRATIGGAQSTNSQRKRRGDATYS